MEDLSMNTLHSTNAEAADKVVVSAGGHHAIVPAKALAPKQLQLARILVPVDFSDLGTKALRYAEGLASQFGSEITLLHVIEQVVYPGDWMNPPMLATDYVTEQREAVVKKLAALSEDRELNLRQVVVVGRAWQEVVAFAQEQQTDLIVIATHGYTGLKHVLLGSVAEKIVRHAPCPVLTVRPDERDFL
jgi:nucleotide-binding universal stress UspA family protein